jgi:competence protein ComGC
MRQGLLGNRRRVQRLAAAFSLIEVLIAILILALGLLGLGAVIPVVVREQRVASQATRAVIAANNAKAYLRARPDLNRLVGDGGGSRGGSGGPSMGGSSQVNPMGFGVWLEDDTWSKTSLWELRSGTVRPSGDLVLQRGGGVASVIPVVDRLWPEPNSGAEPLLVWDVVARRVRIGPPSPSPPADLVERTIEIAVFVRRIDPAIRVAPGRTRLQVLADQGLPAPERRLPVSIDRVTGPTGDGRTPSSSPAGEYSVPLTFLVVVPSPNRPNVIELDPNSSAPQWWKERAAAPGQKLVDNLGNIYTVLRRDDPASADRVVIEPPVPAAAMADFQQVVFTPQIPAAVEVFRITIPRDPATSPNGAGAGMVPWFGQVGQQP